MGPTFDDVAQASGSARRLVLLALRDGGPASRAQLARRTGLAPATITATARALLAEGVAGEAAGAGPAEAVRSGPRGTRLALTPELAWAVGVEVGFRTVRVVVCDLTGRVRGTAQERLGPDHTADDGLPVVVRLVAQALSDAGAPAAGVVGLGLALRAPVDSAHQRVSRSGELSGWSGLTAGRVQDLLGVPVHLGNDADLAALGEHVFGAGRGAATTLTVKLHSGIGAGLIVHGELVTGLHGGAGEIGHTPVDPRGPLCRCGKRGCLDTVAAVPAVLDAAAPRLGALSVSDLLARVHDGDAGATRLVQDAAAAVGGVLAGAVLLLAPERVVVVGALARAGDVVLVPLQRAVEREALPHAEVSPLVVLGELGDRCTPLGAAALALSRSGWLPGSGRSVGTAVPLPPP